MFKKNMLTKKDCSYILALLIACKKYKLSNFYKNKISDLIIRLKNKSNYMDKFDLSFINSLIRIHENKLIELKNSIKKMEMKQALKAKRNNDLKMRIEYIFKYNRFFHYASIVVILLLINSSSRVI